MPVSTILKAKPSEGVISIAPGATVGEATQLLSTKRIGAVIVSPDGAAMAGILSERDIVRELGRRGAACLADPVEVLMTRDVVTCAPSDRTNDVLQRMTDGRFRHMPVMQGDRLVGLISIGDVVKARLTELSTEVDALEGMIKGF
ncbi:MAG: CBS domain-containing protein [Rhodobacteraceae bacterium]|nr:CBS domain-containing protein [Paracoccaceae bacterium]